MTTIVVPSPQALPDLVTRRFDSGALNVVWTSGITYLATDEGWLYLAAVRDGCSRRALDYAFVEGPHIDLVATALRRSVAFHDPATGTTNKVIFRAEGCQYTSSQLAEVAEDVDVRLSVGRTGGCLDNAQQESFWSTLKTEYYERYTFTTRADANTAISSWIETVYNVAYATARSVRSARQPSNTRPAPWPSRPHNRYPRDGANPRMNGALTGGAPGLRGWQHGGHGGPRGHRSQSDWHG